METATETENTLRKQVYEVKLPIWNGPLELLLDLIRSSELDIAEISIAKITEDYLQRISELQCLDMELSADFLVMAATLIRYKVHNIIGDDDSEEEDVEVYKEALIEQVLTYEKYKQAAERLETVLEASPAVVLEKSPRDETLLKPGTVLINEMINDGILKHSMSRLRDDADPATWAEELRREPAWEKVSLRYLLDAFVRVMDRQEHVLHDDGFSQFHEKIDRKMEFLQERLKEADGVSGVSMTTIVRGDQGTSFVPKRSDFFATFVAILELYKLAQLEARQSACFEEIYLFNNIVLQQPVATASP